MTAPPSEDVDPTRSRMMASVRSKDTGPEMRVRRFLHGLGFRYSVHAKRLPGKPDLVLRRHGSVVFVHGCFWHQHLGCRRATMPKTRRAFWVDKFRENALRDARNVEVLENEGWRVYIVWECQTHTAEAL